MESQKHEQFVTQSEFCRQTHISPYQARLLRTRGILPSFGIRPVRIPLNAGVEAITQYAADQGTNPNWQEEP